MYIPDTPSKSDNVRVKETYVEQAERIFEALENVFA